MQLKLTKIPVCSLEYIKINCHNFVVLEFTLLLLTLLSLTASEMSKYCQIAASLVVESLVCVCVVWCAAEAAWPQRGQGGVYRDGRDLHGSGRGVQRLLHQEPPWRAVRTHVQQRGRGRQVQNTCVSEQGRVALQTLLWRFICCFSLFPELSRNWNKSVEKISRR